MTKYAETVDIDKQVVKLIALFSQNGEEESLAGIYSLLLGITSQEIEKVRSTLFLSTDLREDMRQEAFLKLYALLQNEAWNAERCPVFISFWRISLRRHLLSTFYRRQVGKPLDAVEEIAEPSVENPLDVEDAISAVDEKCQENLSAENWQGWRGIGAELCRSILRNRILRPGPEKVSQATIATSFSVTQGYVSIWERWLRNKIQEDFPEL